MAPPPSFQSVQGVLEEMARIHGSLPARPSAEDVEAAKELIRHVDEEEKAHADNILKQEKGYEVPNELFSLAQEIQKGFVTYKCNDKTREALKLVELETIYVLFDDLAQRKSGCVPLSSSCPESPISDLEKEVRRRDIPFPKDDSYLDRAKSGATSISALRASDIGSTSRPDGTSGGEESEKMSYLQLTKVIEAFSEEGISRFNFKSKLKDQVNELPDSIENLFGLINLDLSENRLIALPTKIGGLTSLTHLDLHSNRISEVPNSITRLCSLSFLDLSRNQLTSLPSTLGELVCLEELDLCSNNLSSLPWTIGDLVRLRKLNVGWNDIEELPHAIGGCVTLVELRADRNQLKGLPEAVGRLESLEILSARYNKIKSLPTIMALWPKLKELDISFNELESIPKSLCLATTLVELNVANNFASLQSLPDCIGNLKLLEELNISNNQIRVLPDTFGMLSRLRVLVAKGNPLEVPPRDIAEQGAEAAVKFMDVFVANKMQQTNSKRRWSLFGCPSPYKRMNDSFDQ